jgi:NAD(P)-dependent dehydrogenase (short-subunit alcohol dehydrogenase family)
MPCVALVTGVNSGIGYAIAERLLRGGFALGYATQKPLRRELRESQHREPGLESANAIEGRGQDR